MASKKQAKSEKKATKIVNKKKISAADYEKKVLELAETGLTSEKIGEQLRKEGFHPAEQNKKISKILKEKEKYQNPDLKNTGEKLDKLRGHYDTNKQDKKSMRERDRIAAKLRKIKKYLKIN
jgi:ribosomal protein S15P/S13E